MLISKSRYLSLFNLLFFSTKYFIIFRKVADQGPHTVPVYITYCLFSSTFGNEGQFSVVIVVFFFLFLFISRKSKTWRCHGKRSFCVSSLFSSVEIPNSLLFSERWRTKVIIIMIIIIIIIIIIIKRYLSVRYFSYEANWGHYEIKRY